MAIVCWIRDSAGEITREIRYILSNKLLEVTRYRFSLNTLARRVPFPRPQGFKRRLCGNKNAISTLAPYPFGASWGVGWELGRVTTQQDWYINNVRPALQDMLLGSHDQTPKEVDQILQKAIDVAPKH